MNKRLQELANSAGFVYIKDEGIGWAGQYNSSLPLFAELLVRECAAIVWNDKDSQRMLKHFGVEE